MRNFSVYTLIDVERILSGDTTFVLTVSLILLGAVVLLYGAAIAVFNKKSLVI